MKHYDEMQPVINEPNSMAGPHSKRLTETLGNVNSQPLTGKVRHVARGRKPERGVFEKLSGSGEWWIRYVDAQGRYRREKAGTKSAATLLYRKRKQEALEGHKLPEKLRRALVPFNEIADDAIGYIKGRYARPADDVARMEVLKDWFPGRAAEAITAEDIEAALERGREENHWAHSTVNHHLTLLSLTFRLAIRNRKLKESPVRGIRRRAEDNSRIRFLTPDEEKKLREALRSKPEWAEHEPELDLALHTGLRRTDMYQRLVWENVNLASRVATVPRTKNDAPVHVPLNDDAMRALVIFRSRGDGTGRVVRNAAGETLNVNAHWFPDAVRAAGIKDFRWHDLRHTFASRLRQSGTPLGNIAELLGHKTLAMSKRYAHLSIANLHEAVSRIATGTTVAPGQVAETPEIAYVH
jgi:site-specific recombinase XerD